MKNLNDSDETKEKPLTTSSLIAFIFAFIIVELYFISPIYFIFKYNRKFIKKKHIPFLQIFLNLLNCATYVVIALTGSGDFQNLITNLIGVLICLIVIIQLYISLYNHKKSKNLLLYFYLIFNTIFQIYYFLYKYLPDSYKYLTVIINISMYLSLNIGTYYAFKENKPDRIPILSAVLGLLSSICWTVYSACLEDFDKITLYSNISSFLVIIFTIICYIYLVKNQKPIKKEIKKKKDNNINSSTITNKNEEAQISASDNNNNDKDV